MSGKSRDDTHYENIFDRHVNFRERVIYLNDDVDELSLALFQKALDELERDKDKPIKIEVSSYGGDVYDMLGMVDRIRSSPCHIITRGFGKIMSAATFIVAAGDERTIGQNSWFMIHELSSWMEGKASDLKVEAEHCEDLQEQLNSLYAELSGDKVPKKRFEKLMEKDCYLTAQEVLELGLIDKVIE